MDPFKMCDNSVEKLESAQCSCDIKLLSLNGSSPVSNQAVEVEWRVVLPIVLNDEQQEVCLWYAGEVVDAI